MDLCVCVRERERQRVCVCMELRWDSFCVMSMDFAVLLPSCLDILFLKDFLLLLAEGMLPSVSFWNLFQIPHLKAVSAVSISQQTKYALGCTSS